MWVFEEVWLICAKPTFLHSLDVLIKMFPNSLAVLNQKIGKDQPFSLLSNTVDRNLSGYLVLSRQETRLLFLSL